MTTVREVPTGSDLQVYCLSEPVLVPTWSDRRETRHETHIIQDFEFPGCSADLAFSRDGRYLLGVGTYPPQLRVWDLENLTIHASWSVDYECHRVLPLGQDYEKTVIIHMDRRLSFHDRCKTTHLMRLPSAIRDGCFLPMTADLLLGTASGRLHRLSLEEGRFYEPFTVAVDAECSSVDVADRHMLIGATSDDNKAHFFDPRSGKTVRSLDISKALDPRESSDPIIKFAPGGLRVAMAAGERAGLWDLRMSAPLHVMDHAGPVADVLFHNDSLLTTDGMAVRIWRHERHQASFELTTPTHRIRMLEDSGFLVATSETERLQAYLIPSLGLAPPFLSGVETRTEELTQTPVTYQNYRFVTRGQLHDMGLSQLAQSGSNLVKPYLHGFYVDAKLFRQATATAESRVAPEGPAIPVGAIEAESVADDRFARRFRTAAFADIDHQALAASLEMRQSEEKESLGQRLKKMRKRAMEK